MFLKVCVCVCVCVCVRACVCFLLRTHKMSSFFFSQKVGTGPACNHFWPLISESGSSSEPSLWTWPQRAGVCAQLLSVRLFAIPWILAHQAPLHMGFSRQEYWSGLPCPGPGIELVSLTSPALAGRFFYLGNPRGRKCPELPSAKGHRSRRDTVHAGQPAVELKSPLLLP